MLNPRQIEAFRTVIIMGGVTAAAQALSISQPAVTRLIHDLQYTLGLKLFVKRGTRLAPTNEALSLFREVERQFVGLERIQAAALSLRERRMGTLRIAALPAFNVGFLPRLVSRYLQHKPGLNVTVYGSSSSQVADWGVSGFCELGFVQLPLDFPSLDVEPLPQATAVAGFCERVFAGRPLGFRSLDVEPLPQATAGAVLPQDHRLAARSVLGPRDFAGESFVSLEQMTQLRYQIDALFASERITREVRIETPLSMIACALVAAGAGVSIVDPFTAAEYCGRGVVVRPFHPAILFDIAVIWAAGRCRSALAQDFAHQVRAAVIGQGR